MTFFLMRNKFQQQGEAEENPPQQAGSHNKKSTLSASGGNLLNALFGTKPSSPKMNNRKSSHASSNASSPSRASSGGRSAAFPPKRISFDEPDFDGGREGGSHNRGSGRASRGAQPNTPRSQTGYSTDNRPEDHSSGTTDPPDEDALEDLDDRQSTRSDRGSDTSGPDSPDEVQLDDDLVMFMRQFVEQIFQNTKTIDQHEKNKFGEYARAESGRLWFARFINSQRINYSSKVDEGTFFRLVQYCAIVLFECYQEEDYAPVKILMNICFTFYKEVVQGSSRKVRREFLYHHLRKQAIWHSLKFWNAAYFDAMQSDRAKRAQREQWNNESSHPRGTHQRTSVEQPTEEDFTYRTLCDFVQNMRAFHVSKESVTEFVRKQANSLTPDQFRALRDQLESMYR